jgi:toxin ParE1/3/4
MAQLRISRAAQADLVSILTTSLERWGERGRARYAALLAAAMRKAAADPQGPTTRERTDLGTSIRSFHIRHARREHGVGAPVHVLYYRVTDESSIEIIRVLHERMEPQRHVGTPMRAIRARRARRR